MSVLARGLRPRTPSPSGSLALAPPAGHRSPRTDVIVEQ
jgi:hypothetical protein